jgi:tetratricopeptide (TPR) repeat protein
LAKKPARKKSPSSPQPEPAQLKAVERLIANGKRAEAVAKARQLVEAFPKHSGPWRALVEALESAGDSAGATLAAFEWAESRPQSLPAQECLLGYAKRRGHLMLAERTAQQVRALGGSTPGFPLTEAVKERLLHSPDGRIPTQAQMERFDIGKVYLEGGQFEAAVQAFSALDELSANNNRAMALYHLGRIDEAADVFMAGWQADSDNLLALGWLVRLRLYRGDSAGAEGLCTPLAATTARRLEDALGQQSGLLLMRQYQAAWDAFERIRDAAWLTQDASPGSAMLLNFAACAASRVGRADEARDLWRESRRVAPGLRLAQANLDALAEDGQGQTFPVIFDISFGPPSNWLSALRATPSAAEARLDRLTAANAYLETLYLGADEALRALAKLILERRANAGDSEAAERLKSFARLPIGSKNERFGLLTDLRSQGLIGADEALDFWDGQRVTQVKIIDTEITREPEPSDLPDDVLETLGEAVGHFNRGDLERAERGFEEILRRFPEHPMLLGNLASARAAMGQYEESRTLLRQVLDRKPDYLIARCNLATLLISEGQLDEAQELLAGLAERPKMHIQDAFALYGAMAQLQSARGNLEAAREFVRYLEGLVGDEDDARRLAQIKRKIEPLGSDATVKSLASGLANFVRQMKRHK